MAAPALSVVMAAYNPGPSLNEAVASIREQTFEDWELVLVDDGSDEDNEQEIVRLAAEDERIRIVRNEVNLGLATALNRGWQSARSALIARMDADDLSLPERFQQQFAFLRKRPDVAVLGSGATIVDASGRTRGLYRPAEEHDEILARILTRTPFVHPSVVIRRRFLERLGGYDPCLRRAQDFDLWLRGVHIFRYHNLTEPLIIYRRPGRLSRMALWYGARVRFTGGTRLRGPLAGAYYAGRFLVGGIARSMLGVAGPWNR
jgi:glycosyltransferase involved in cell wall biosynthesis